MPNREQFEDEISLVDILKFFVKHKMLILIVTLLVTIVGGYKSSILTSSYTTESGIVVLWPEYEVLLESKINIKDIGELFFQQFENRKKSIQELIISPSVITPVIKKAEEEKLISEGKLSYINFRDKNSKIIEIVQNGEIIKIRVNMPTAELTKLFSEEITKNVVEKIKELFSKYESISIKKSEKKDFVVKIAYTSDVQEVIRTKDKRKILLMSIFIGIFLGIFLAMIREGFERIKGTV